MLNKLRIKISPETEVDEEADYKNETNSDDDKRANSSLLFEENLSFLRNLKFLKSWPKLSESNLKEQGLFKTRKYEPGKLITADICKSKYVFIVKSGSLLVFLKANLNEPNAWNRNGSATMPSNEDTFKANQIKKSINTNYDLNKESSYLSYRGNYNDGHYHNDYYYQYSQYRNLDHYDHHHHQHHHEMRESYHVRNNFSQVINYLNALKEVESETSKLIERDKFKNETFRIKKNSKNFKDNSGFYQRTTNCKEHADFFQNALKKTVSIKKKVKAIDALSTQADTDVKLKLPYIVNRPNNDLSILRRSDSDFWRIKESDKKIQKEINDIGIHLDDDNVNETIFQLTKNELFSNENSIETSNWKNLHESMDFNLHDKMKKSLSVFNLLIKKIYVGEQMGLASVLYGNQPKMKLISNGCECILLSKDLLIEHSDINYLVELRKLEGPFPKLESIKYDYSNHLSWREFTKKELEKTWKRTRKYQASKEY